VSTKLGECHRAGGLALQYRKVLKFEVFLILAKVNNNFWSTKKVFITGHTGFKGGWLCLWLNMMGAKVTGYSLQPVTTPSFFKVANIEPLLLQSHTGDICNLALLYEAVDRAQPDVLIHMAAQSLVRESYLNPVETYATNVMGTVNVLECVRRTKSIKSVVVVTTDKCYENKEWEWGYRENEPMGGYDPYSSSKGCAELVTSAFRNSYFSSRNTVCVATARAGNVIGGGDWSVDRLIPDAIKAFENDSPLTLRNPLAIRPWQHVLEPLSGYLLLAEKLHDGQSKFASAWNFGPRDEDESSVEYVVNLLMKQWGKNTSWVRDVIEQPYETHSLKLDCSKAKFYLKWESKLSLEIAIKNIYEWQIAYRRNQDMQLFSISQIKNYIDL
jgi:CDP-glucose 4,6-dehydratase